LATTLYLDCFSGASGDMVLGALLDLGLPIENLRQALGSLAVEYGSVSADRVLRSGIVATKFRVHAAGERAEPHHQHSAGQPHHHHSHTHHSLTQIESAIGRSALSAAARGRAVALFHRLAEAEAAIHQMPVEAVHLHEVGALDSIIDIVAAVHGLEWLGVDRVVASAVNVGSGQVECAHGIYPVPAPATARLLEGVPVYAAGPATELTTPTGALLVTGYAQTYGPLPRMRVDRIGYGAGEKDFPKHPNVLRMLVGSTDGPGTEEQVVALECEIDDMNPQLFGPLMDQLYAGGAYDVFYTAVQMKKNRPGTLVTVIAPPACREQLAGVLFAETTTIGVRYREMLRERLDREVIRVETPLGEIRFKVARRDGQVVNAAPEFEDCARAAAERGVPIKDVQARAIKAWLESGTR
jgi:pyridinium-3,5-bisthiocarboxylic acid mononucleotide nickel chelatase